jgi:Flp pilus assembly protein TadD
MSQPPTAARNPEAPPDRPEGKASISKEKLLAICLALVGLTIWTYLPSTHNGFVNIDDGAYVYANPHVRSGFSWEGIRWAFTAFEKSLWHPVTWFSIMLDCQLFGLNPWGHHLVSLLLHAINTGLLFLLFERMTKAVWRSAFVAALFALHPVHVESVAWVAERKDVLSTFFALLTVLAYLKYVCCAGEEKSEMRREKIYYALALLFFALGLMSKPMVVTLPILLLLLDFWPLHRFQPATRNLQPATTAQHSNTPILQLVLEKLPFFGAALLIGIVAIFAQKSSGALQPTDRLPMGYRIANAIVSYAHYLAQTLWPAKLAVYYPYPKHFPFLLVGGLAMLGVAISILAIWLWNRRSYLAFGWIWFLVTLAPVIGLIQVGNQAYADRYMYLPLIGLAVIFAWGAHDLTRPLSYGGTVLAAAAAAVLLACIVLTRQQIGFWKDSVTLFTRALAVTTNNNVAHNNLGTALQDQGHPSEAIPHFQEVVKLTPGNVVAQRNLATALFAVGKLDEALPHAQEAVRLNPRDGIAQSLLGTILGNKGQTDQAIAHLQEAVRLIPNDFKSRMNLGVALAQKRRFDEAAVQFQEALRINPSDTTVQRYLRACQAASTSPKR